MRKNVVKLQNNSPVVIWFSLLCFVVLVLGILTDGYTSVRFFSVYHSSARDIFTYPRFILHVLGHSNYSHFVGNIMMILAIGPGLEERYGSRNLLLAMLLTALVSGMVQWLFFRDSMLMGASGILLMMIVMSSVAGMKNGCIPVTLILVLVLFVGGEIMDAITVKDNISQMAHIVGGLCGAVLGTVMRK